MSASAETMSFVPVGIDVGTLHARIAMISENAGGSVQMVSNTQGSRYTPALSTLEDDTTEQVLIGDAARKSLQVRKQKNIHHSSVRHLVRLSSSNLAALEEKDVNGDEKKEDDMKEDEDKKASKLSSSFFSHMSQLVCDASSCHPTRLKCVASVPMVDPSSNNAHSFSPEEIQELVQHIQKGVGKTAKAAGPDPAMKGKSNNKEIKALLSSSVVGVISEAAAVCVAHGLTEASLSTSNMSSMVTFLQNLSLNDGGSPVGIPDNKNVCPVSWSKCLVINWGASGVTATILNRVEGKGENKLVDIEATKFSSAAAGSEILRLVVKHAATTFERKTRCSEVLSNYKARTKLESASETALKTLVRTNTVHMAVDGLYEGMDLQLPLSRPRIEMLLGPVVRSGEALITSVVGDKTMDAVLLSGSVCEMPIVKAMIDRLFPSAWKGDSNISVDESVAIGCARYAHQIVMAQKELQAQSIDANSGASLRELLLQPSLQVVLNPVEISVGILNSEGSVQNMSPLLQKDSPLPTSTAKIISVEEGTSTIALVDSTSGGESPLIIVEIPVPEGQTQIGLYVALTVEGELSISIDGEDVQLL
jgi:molecular chaperone DnaK (HSP70)